MQRETRQALAETGIRVVEAEYVFLTPELEAGDYRRLIEVGADFGRLCDLAAEYGLIVVIEFVAPTSVNSIEKCARVIAASEKTNAGILVDSLHLFRTGGSVQRLAAMPPELVVNCQLSDGLMSLGATWQPDMPKIACISATEISR